MFPLITALPEEEIARAALHYKVGLVCLSIALADQLQPATDTVRALRKHNWTGLVEVGGPVFLSNEEAWHLTGADFLGGDAESCVTQANLLLAARRQA